MGRDREREREREDQSSLVKHDLLRAPTHTHTHTAHIHIINSLCPGSGGSIPLQLSLFLRVEPSRWERKRREERKSCHVIIIVIKRIPFGLVSHKPNSFISFSHIARCVCMRVCLCVGVFMYVCVFSLRMCVCKPVMDVYDQRLTSMTHIHTHTLT